MARHRFELPPEKLRRACDPSVFSFETTKEIAPLRGSIGQDRAVAAIDFGLQIKTFGYNIYVSGSTGTGKNTTVKDYLVEAARNQPAPPDWCYVYNFGDPYQPAAIRLPAGRGPEFARDMEQFSEAVKREIPRAFEGEQYESRKTEVVKDIQAEREALSNKIQEEAKSQGFSLEVTQLGVVTVPLMDGKPLGREEYEALPEDMKKEIQERGEALKADFNQVLAQAKRLEKEANERVAQLDKEIVLAAIGPMLQWLREKYSGEARVVKYLDDVQNDIVQNLDEFRQTDKEATSILGLGKLSKDDPTEKYKVNVLVTNESNVGAPVVVENNPTYYNLFGRIDYRARLGTMVTEFDMIKAGAVHKANGGYLVVQARDVLLSPLSWDALKRTLRSGEARIENIGEQYSVLPTASLRPEPIPLDVKVVMIGTPQVYQLLYHLDEDFRKLFRVRADFGIDMDRTDEHVQRYAAFISARCGERNLKHFDRSGVCRIVEYGSWLAEDQNKLSTRFIDLADVVSESSFWAEQENSPVVTASHVDKAIDAKVYRSNLIEQRIGELIDNGVIMIDTQGRAIGQVNGLAIQAFGDYFWGKPSRVTARTSVGRAGIINIERETQMSGRLHNKGFLTLAGYLAGKYGTDKPLTLSGSVTFEQLYDEVDGDSASSTELYALLSSLARLPLKQNIAVTGSVNQHGEIQAIGGVTRKIEGFFDVCKAKGLTGDQGVIIPEANVRNLMLREEVVQAVREGKFHIFAVKTIDEGIELLTDTPAGQRLADGTWEPGTVHYLVDQTLRSFAEELKRFGTPTPTRTPPNGEEKLVVKAAKGKSRSKKRACNGSCDCATCDQSQR